MSRECRYCGRETRSQRRQPFCNRHCRRSFNQEAHRARRGDRLLDLERRTRSERFEAPTVRLEDATPCRYCGMPAQAIDHVIPRSRLGDLDVLRITPGDQRRVWLTPSCTECNSILGSRLFDRVSDRKAFVKDRLRVRYQRYLAAPRWSPEELTELGHTLRQAVLDEQAARRTIIERLRW